MKTFLLTAAVALVAVGCGGGSEKPPDPKPSGLTAAIDCLKAGGATITGKDQQLRTRLAAVGATGPDGSPMVLYTAARQYMRDLGKQARREAPEWLIHRNIDGNALASVSQNSTLDDWILATGCADRLPAKTKHGDGGLPPAEFARTTRHTAMFEQICGLPVGNGEDQLMKLAATGASSPEDLVRRTDTIPRNVVLNARQDPAKTCWPFRVSAGLPGKLSG